MGLKYAKDAVKIGFADISIYQNTPDKESYFGYFADTKKSPEEQKIELGTLANEQKCYNEPLFKDDTKYSQLAPTPNETVITDSDMPLPQIEELTIPPMQKNEDLQNLAMVAAGILGAVVLIKLIS